MNLFRAAFYLINKLTLPELALESAICKLGEPYRVQYVFVGARHIADFVLPGRRLVIEVDGSSHNDLVQIRKDLKESIWLEKNGWAVVRCKNEEAMRDPGLTLVQCLSTRLHTRPSVQDLESALGQLPPEPPRKASKRPRRAKQSQQKARPSAPDKKARKRVQKPE